MYKGYMKIMLYDQTDNQTTRYKCSMKMMKITLKKRTMLIFKKERILYTEESSADEFFVNEESLEEANYPLEIFIGDGKSGNF